MPTAPPEEILSFLKRAHDEFQPLSEQIIFDKERPLHRNTISLYGSILELTGSCILLTDKRLVTGVPILLRTILEAYVDLVNLVENPQYGYNLEASYLKEWLKILEEARKGKNEYLRAISEASSLDQSIDEWRNSLKKLESKGYKVLKIEKKFERAGMEKEYRSIYNLLCSDSHNNLGALVSRHVEREQTDFSIVFYKAYTPEDSAVYVGTNAEILVRATQLIHKFLDSPVQDAIKAYRVEFDALRGGS